MLRAGIDSCMVNLKENTRPRHSVALTRKRVKSSTIPSPPFPKCSYHIVTNWKHLNKSCEKHRCFSRIHALTHAVTAVRCGQSGVPPSGEPAPQHSPPGATSGQVGTGCQRCAWFRSQPKRGTTRSDSASFPNRQRCGFFGPFG